MACGASSSSGERPRTKVPGTSSGVIIDGTCTMRPVTYTTYYICDMEHECTITMASEQVSVIPDDL